VATADDQDDHPAILELTADAAIADSGTPGCGPVAGKALPKRRWFSSTAIRRRR